MAHLISASRPLRVVCHKAFDETPDEDQAIDQLMTLGINEVLTSGHQKTALEGSASLAKYLARVGDKLTIMAGGTVRAENIKALVT